MLACVSQLRYRCFDEAIDYPPLSDRSLYFHAGATTVSVLQSSSVLLREAYKQRSSLLVIRRPRGAQSQRDPDECVKRKARNSPSICAKPASITMIWRIW